MTRKFILFLASISIATATMAQEVVSDTSTAQPAALSTEESYGVKPLFWWSAGANVASNYLWRGYDQSYYGNMFDPAIQPSVTLGYGDFYVDLWYNFSTISTYQELDMTLGYEYKNLSVTVYDVWCEYGKAFWQNDFLDDENHSLTATIEYTFFDRLRLHWGPDRPHILPDR